MLVGLTTARAQITSFPYFQGFESGLSGWSVIDYDMDAINWAVVDNVNFFMEPPRTGDYMAMSTCWDEEGMYFPDNFLVSPAVSVPASGVLNLSFWIKATVADMSVDQYYAVYVSTTGNTADDFLMNSPLVDDVASDIEWEQVSVSLAAYRGETIYIGIRHYNSFYTAACLDDIELKIAGSAEVKLPVQQVTTTTGAPISITAHYTGSTDGLLFNWTSQMAAAGNATMNTSDSVLTITYSAFGIDTVTVTATNASGVATDKMVVRVIDPTPVSSFPYYTGFEVGDDTNWTLAGNINNWYIGPVTSYTGSRSLYISDNRGMTHTYEPAYNCVSYAYRQLNLTEGSYMVSFDYKVQGSLGDFMRAWIAPASDVPTVDLHPGNIAFGNPYVNIATYNPTGWFPIGERLQGNSAWENESTDVVISNDGTYMLVFMWRNAADEFSNMPAAIDNVNITKLICHAVDGPNVDSLASTTAILLWSDTLNTAATYTVYNMADTSVVATGITDTFYHLSGLNPLSQYTFGVSADCSPTLQSPIHTVSFTTRCTPDTLPWNENFNSTATTSIYLSQYNPCWKSYHLYANWVYLENNYNHDTAATGKAMRVYGYNSTVDPTLVILPPFEMPTSQLMVTFWMTSSDTNAYLEWGYISNPDSVGFFVPMVQIYPDEIDTWEEKLVVYDAPAEGEIAFRYRNNNYGNGVIHIDDITVQQRPTCERPTSLSISDILFDQSTLHIHDNDGNNSYTIDIYNSDTLVTSFTTSDTSVVLSNLRYNTSYTVGVTPTCDDGLSYPSLFTSFRTDCTVISSDDLPWRDGFEEYSGIVTNAKHNIPCMWFVGNGSPYNFLIDTAQARVHEGEKSLRFYPNNNYGKRLVAVLPEFDDDISTLRLDFWGQYEATFASATDTLEVGYLTNLADTSAFVVTSRCVGVTDMTLHYYATFFGAPSGARMAIRYLPANNICYWWIDDITVELIPECLAPQASIYAIDSTSVTIDINDTINNNVINYSVAVYADDTVLVDSLVLIGGGQHQIDNLVGNTRYTFYLRTQCIYYNSDSTILQCRTLCQKAATPYVNGFEIDASGDVPLCFTHLVTPYYMFANLQNGCHVNSIGGHDGGQCMILEGSSVNVVALPETRDNLSDLMLSFWHRTATYNDINNGILQVGYLTDITDTATFVLVATYHPYSDGGYHEEEVIFTYAPAGAVAAFRHVGDAPNNYGQYINQWYIDDISFQSSFCLRPQSFTVEYVSDTLAMVHIDDTNQNLGHYYVLTSTITGDTIEAAIANTDDFSIAGLTPNTHYTISIASVCTDGLLSYSLTSTFYTSPCAPIPHDQLPWGDDFNQYATGFHPACWSIINPYYPTPIVSTDLYHSSNKSLCVTTSDIAKPTTLVLPLFEDAPEELKLTFWLYTTAANVGIQVGVMGNPSDTGTFVPVTTIDTTTPLTWQLVQSSFDGIAQGYLAIRYHGTPGTVYIDDILVDSNSLCMRPSAIIADNIYDTYADLSIVSGDANSFLVSYTDGITDNVITLTDTNHVTLTNLTPNTVYTVTAQSICSDNSLTGAFTYTFRSDCLPISDLPWTDDFSSLTTGQYHEIPCWQILTGTMQNGWQQNNYFVYPDFAGNPSPGVALTADINGLADNYSFIGNRKSYAILPNIEAEVSQMTIALDVWYDNTVPENLQFLEVGYMPNISDGTSFIPIDTFLCVTSSNVLWVRDTVFIGDYELNSPRLALRYGIYVTNGQGTIVIDNVTIDGIITPIVDSLRCPNPTFAEAEVGEDSITFYWYNDGGEYELILMGDSIDDETPIVTSDTSYTFYGLQPNTTYTVKIRKHCSSAFISTWTQQSATTLIHPCYTPEDVEVNDITLSSATINWAPAEDAQELFQVIVINGYIIDTHLVAATTLLVDNLYPGIDYQVSVRAVCDEDYYSEWTTPVPFSTPSCDYPTDVRVSDITNTTALVSWNGNADKYELLYGIEVIAGSGTTLLIENGSSAQLTDLIRDTVYDVYLRSVCDDGIYSEWTEKLQFHTTNVGIGDVAPHYTAMHPNPASAFVHVTGLHASSIVTFIDLNGRQCGRWVADNERLAIDVSHLARGVYFVRITDGSHSEVHKLILD